MARYRDAVQWIADHDDSDLGWPTDGRFHPSVSLVADLFGKPHHTVHADVRIRRLQRLIQEARYRSQTGAACDEQTRALRRSEFVALLDETGLPTLPQSNITVYSKNPMPALIDELNETGENKQS